MSLSVLRVPTKATLELMTSLNCRYGNVRSVLTLPERFDVSFGPNPVDAEVRVVFVIYTTADVVGMSC